jgi:hypothetical protein
MLPVVNRVEQLVLHNIYNAIVAIEEMSNRHETGFDMQTLVLIPTCQNTVPPFLALGFCDNASTLAQDPALELFHRKCSMM